MPSLLDDIGHGAAMGAPFGGPVGAAVGSLGGVIAHYAPDLLGTLVSQPVAQGITGARAAVDAVVAATGTDDSNAAMNKAMADPSVETELRVRLAQIAADARRAELDARDRQGAAQLAALNAQLADLAEARARDAQIRAAGSGQNVRADIMLCAVTVGLIACIVAAAAGKLGDTAVFGMVSAIAGMLSGCFKDAFGFEFGSSRQSESKTNAIVDLARNSVPADLLPRPAALVPAADVQAR